MKTCLCAAILATALSFATNADEPKAGTPVSLFNGKDLSGWPFSAPAQTNVWSVKDGVLHSIGKPAGYIRTATPYTNYRLTLEFRHLSKGNGGVLLRVVGPDKVWPKSVEAQGMAGHVGDIFTIDGFPLKTDRARGRHTVKLHPSNEKPLGEWNTYEITVDHGNLELKVNGLVQNTGTDFEEVPGTIALQSEGAEMEFRNLRLVPIE